MSVPDKGNQNTDKTRPILAKLKVKTYQNPAEEIPVAILKDFFLQRRKAEKKLSAYF